MKEPSFEWHDDKNQVNYEKHGVSFEEAQLAFFDSNRIIAEDISHSHYEQRYYCIGRVNNRIMTVRFTYRSSKIRIIGAGYWREGKKLYEEANRKIH